jgi:hypothetical protein
MIIKLQLIFQPILRGFAVGEVNIEDQKITPIGNNSPMLIIKAVYVQRESQAFWTLSGKETHSAIALFISGGKKGTVAWDVLQFWRHLIGSGLCFLDAENIRHFFLQPFEKALAINGSQAVHIPREDSQCAHLFPSVKWLKRLLNPCDFLLHSSMILQFNAYIPDMSDRQ